MTDPCCWLCRTPHGTCATNHQCDHHRAYAIREKGLGPSRLTYKDPTGQAAANNVDNERSRKRGRR